jgi:hypothetical protein
LRDGYDQPQDHRLRADVAVFRLHELRQDREREKVRLRIQQARDHPLPKRSCARTGTHARRFQECGAAPQEADSNPRDVERACQQHGVERGRHDPKHGHDAERAHRHVHHCAGNDPGGRR